MGNFRFSEVLRYSLLSASALVAAFLAAIVFASPASANPDGDRVDQPEEKLWDTDNLLYTANTGAVSARTFGVPFHDYGGYLRTEQAAPCLRYPSGLGIVYAELAASVYGGGCPSGFSAMTVWCLHDPHDPGALDYWGPPVRRGGRQDCYHIYGRSTIYNAPAGVGLCGVLSNGRWSNLSVLHPRSTCSNPFVRVYNSSRTHQACKAAVADAFFQTVSGGRNEFPVLEITDTESVENSPALKDWGTSRNTGCDEFALAQDRLLTTTASNGGYWLGDRGRLQQSSMPAHTASARSVNQQRVAWVTRSGFAYTLHIERGLTVPQAYAARVDAGSDLAISPAGTTLTVPSPAPSWPATKTASGAALARLAGFHFDNHLPLPQAIGGNSAGAWCPADFHPRGEDSVYRIGSGTGRTLTGLSDGTLAQLADKYWCRSDVRYPIRYAPNSITGRTCGTGGVAPVCPSGVSIPTSNFTAWGRVNCYYTALSIDSTGKYEYPHPVPLCTDSDTGTKRNWTEAELDRSGTGHLHDRHRAVPCRRRRHHDLRSCASYPSARRIRHSDLGGLHSRNAFKASVGLLLASRTSAPYGWYALSVIQSLFCEGGRNRSGSAASR